MKKIQIYLLLIISVLLFSLKIPEQNPKNQLKAILVVGHQEDGTESAIKKMNEIDSFLKENDVLTYTFYDKDAIWEDITAKSEGAHFFIYSGHGNGSCNLCIETPHFVSNEQITNDLKLDDDAVVIFKSVCYGAGSSASDDADIGINEAEKRVSNYALLFFKSGTACYFANNSGKGALTFLENFFEGKTVRECYVATTDFWYDIELTKDWDLGYNAEISIATSDWGGTVTHTTYINGEKTVTEEPAIKSYSIALIANPNFTIAKLKE